eukprot:UN04306
MEKDNVDEMITTFCFEILLCVLKIYNQDCTHVCLFVCLFVWRRIDKARFIRKDPKETK